MQELHQIRFIQKCSCSSCKLLILLLVSSCSWGHCLCSLFYCPLKRYQAIRARETLQELPADPIQANYSRTFQGQFTNIWGCISSKSLKYILKMGMQNTAYSRPPLGAGRCTDNNHLTPVSYCFFSLVVSSIHGLTIVNTIQRCREKSFIKEKI